MRSPVRGFPNFLRLPNKLQDQILREEIPITDRILVRIRSKPAYIKGTRRINTRRPSKRAKITYRYICYPDTPPLPLLSISYNSRQEYLYLYHDTLQIEPGPPIRFSSANNRIVFDLISLKELWKYYYRLLQYLPRNYTAYRFEYITKVARLIVGNRRIQQRLIYLLYNDPPDLLPRPLRNITNRTQSFLYRI